MSQGYQKKHGADEKEFSGWVLPEDFAIEVGELTGALREGLHAVGMKAALVRHLPLLAQALEVYVGCLDEARRRAG